jgi:O-antigen ligase
MLSILICIVAFLGTFVLARRSLVWGMAACVGFGYVFGALRANILDTLSFLMWDASVLGLYASYFSTRRTPEEIARTASLRLWVAVLILWPVVLTIVPVQYPLIQLVGLRGNTLLLPFLLIGARLEAEELDELAIFLAAFNLMALGIGVTEYFIGLETFFPHNPVTQLMYNSRDVAGYTAFRIPAFFVNAHAYSGTMVMTIPFLFGAWNRASRTWARTLISAGMVAAMIGVFLGASRTHTIALFAIAMVAIFAFKLKTLARAGLIIMLIFTAWVVSNSERLQRFSTLFDSEFISERIAGSLDLPIVEAALEYPFGVGIGGGGTSIPYFLQDEILEPVAAENEYIRIMLEEGILGLVLWIAFIVWLLTRQNAMDFEVAPGRKLARFVALSYFALACLGTGMLTSVPQTALMLAAAGWAAEGSNDV